MSPVFTLHPVRELDAAGDDARLVDRQAGDAQQEGLDVRHALVLSEPELVPLVPGNPQNLRRWGGVDVSER
jgi:hypothetical protein